MPEDLKDHKDLMMKFFDTYGTHVVKKVHMGAKFIATGSYDRKEKYKLELSGKEVNYEPKLSAMGIDLFEEEEEEKCEEKCNNGDNECVVKKDLCEKEKKKKEDEDKSNAPKPKKTIEKTSNVKDNASWTIGLELPKGKKWDKMSTEAKLNEWIKK